MTLIRDSKIKIKNQGWENCVIISVKGRGNIHPGTGHEGPKGE
jgi:hypothetical protein